MSDLTLLTDFGTQDGYLGAMEGVVAAGAPGAAIHDISHAIPHGDVVAAARALERYWLWWPPGTVRLSEPSLLRSATFHGRDLFAPAAASLAAGGSLHTLGTLFSHPVLLSWRTIPGPLGRIVSWDHFGNIRTDLAPENGSRIGRVRVEDVALPLLRTYADVEPGEPPALLDSQGRVEIAVRDGSARKRLRLEPASD